MGKIKIALIQMKMQPEPKINLAYSLDQIKKAAEKGAKIICLPELFKSYYFCQSEDHRAFDLSETIPGPTTMTLCAAAKEKQVVIIASLFEKRAPGIYHNTTVVINPDGTICGKYRKNHIPDDPHFYEKFYFTPGDTGYPVFETPFAKIGVLICWDQWFPEAARIMALKGAEIIFYPTAIGWLPEEKQECGQTQVDAWITIQRSHAIANGCFIASINRVGFEAEPKGESGIEFWGSSFICGPDGQMLNNASANKEATIIKTIDLAAIEDYRKIWPFFRDRRVDTYADILKVADQ